MFLENIQNYLDELKYNDQPSVPDKDSNVVSAKDLVLL